MKKALLVIDVQKYFHKGETGVVVKRIRDYLKNYAQKYSVVFFTVFRNDAEAPLWNISGWQECTDSPDTDLYDEMKEFVNENNLVYKNVLSAVKIPKILRGIVKAGVSEVHLCGFDTDCCILATAYDLFDRGIKPVVLENLTWSTSKDRLHNAAIQIVTRNIGFVEKVDKL